MQLRRLIASGLLLSVLLAPALGLALCVSPASAVRACCAGHCTMNRPAQRRGQAAAPCRRRQAPMPAFSESSARIVAPVQIASLAAASSNAMLPAAPVLGVRRVTAPPALAPPLSLLCTFLI